MAAGMHALQAPTLLYTAPPILERKKRHGLMPLCVCLQTRALLLRDPHAARQPYKAAIEDTMILTMKGISSGMQNTG